MFEISAITAVVISCSIWLLFHFLPASSVVDTLHHSHHIIRRFLLHPLGLSYPVVLAINPKSTLNGLLHAKCPHLAGKRAWYTPSMWLFGSGHFQTAYSAIGDFSKVFRIEYERKYLDVPDGGRICLDITPPLSKVPADHRPILVCTHGLTGGSHESYVRAVLDPLTRPVDAGGHGWRAVVVNSRGCSNGPLLTPKLYHCGATWDLKNAMLYIAHMFPDAPTYGIGFSLGAGMMTKYLGTESHRTTMKAGIVLGTPWDLMKGHIALQSDIRGLYYSRAMGRNLQTLFKRHVAVLSKHPKLDSEAVLANPNMTLYEFDTLVTRVAGGFESAEHYYRTQSPNNFVSGIVVPFLSMNARDDPIATCTAIPFDAVADNPNLIFATTKHGGHLGWFDGFLSFSTKRRWVTQPVIEWLVALQESDPSVLRHPAVKEPRTPWIGNAMVFDPEDSLCGFREVEQEFVIGGTDDKQGELLAGL